MDRTYSDAERAAVVAAYSAPGTRAEDVSKMAAAGELTDHNGDKLPGFGLPSSTVRDLARKARNAARRPSPPLELPAKDAVEALRQQLVNLATAEIKALEGQTDGKRDLDRMRQAGKVLEQLSKVPGPTAKSSGISKVSPVGDTVPNGGQCGASPAGALLREHRAAPQSIPAEHKVGAGQAPEPVPKVSPELDLRERFERDLRASIARAEEEQRQQQADPAAPTTGKRRPVEDTDSIAPGTYVREPVAREAMRYGTHLVQRDRAKGHL